MANALGGIVAAGGSVMLIPAAFSLVTGDGMAPFFVYPALVSLVTGVLVFFLTRGDAPYVSGRDVFLIVGLTWVVLGIVGAAPFVFSGLMGPMDAFFDSMAGFTTTGASTLAAPEETARSFLLWRSMTQWIGGIGIVVLFVAVAPLVGFGATQLYAAEAATPIQQRMTPRIQDTAKALLYIYLALSLGIAAALLLAGMGPFDAVNHALTTVSTGGYSTRSDSISAFDSWKIEAVVVIGMVLSGANFALYFQASQGRLSSALRNREFLAYLGIICGATVVMTASLYAFDYQKSVVVAFREAIFQSASLTTGTAFSTADWNTWDPLSQGMLMILMAIGGCAGSTTGGLKVIRVVLLARNAAQDSFRMVHPRAVTPLTLDERVIPERLRNAFLGFFFVYVAALAAGTLLIALHQVPLGSAFGSVFACLNITGISIGPVGDAEFYSALPGSAKAILTFFMLLGRLELFTVLVLLTPAFWRG